MSPFLVTTSHVPEHDGATGYVVSRVAVTTLEEASQSVINRVCRVAFDAGTTEGYQPFEDAARALPESGGSVGPLPGFEDAARALPESGGSVGPLPDGTVIEVEQRQWYQLAIEVGMLPNWQQGADTPWVDKTKRDILAAFNAREVA